MGSVLDDVRRDLEESKDEKVRESEQRFFKEKVRVIGVRNPLVWKIAKEHFRRVRALGREEVYSLCEELFRSGYLEESFVACGWSHWVCDRYEEGDLGRFEGWVEKYVNNWATCDTLCNHTVGAFIERYPEYVAALMRWARSGNMWMRRAAAVSLIVPAKKGKFLEEAFRISDVLMGDSEDLVQKGFGWLLKEESRTRQKEVFCYVMKNKEKMPRTALRYAIEKMPADLRAEAMKK